MKFLRTPFAADSLASDSWSLGAIPVAADLIGVIPAAPEAPAIDIAPDAGVTHDPLALATAPANPVGNSGDRGMLANLARASFNVSGAGIKVGILSDSFNLRGGYVTDQKSGALAAGVKVLAEGPSGNDEGRAMAQLIHQVAPGASLSFYTAFRSEADFANGIKALAADGAKVIVDDVTYLDEPFFQDGGIIQQAVASVVAKGVSYFTAASNQGTNFYEHGFTGVSAALPGLAGTYKAMNFGTSAAPVTMQSLTIAKGATVTLDLQWDQPFKSIGTGHASANSLGLVLYDANNRIVASALTNRTGGDPVQILRFSNTTAGTAFRLAIITNGGSTVPGLFKYIAYGSGLTINDANAGKGSGTVIGHEMQAGANSVGAIAAASTPALGGNGRIEGFSSVGPGTILFDAGGNRLSQAISGNKVNFVAPDGVTTSVFSPFYGTSAAAPDAAAVAALMLQANPSLTPAQVTAMLAASATPITGQANGTGAGLILATGAVQRAIAAKTASATPSTTNATNPGASSGTGAGALVSGQDAASPLATSFAGPAVPSWSTAPLALAQDPTALSDFLVSLAPGTDMTNIQATSNTAFALMHNLDNAIVELFPIAA